MGKFSELQDPQGGAFTVKQSNGPYHLPQVTRSKSVSSVECASFKLLSGAFVYSSDWRFLFLFIFYTFI